MSLREAIALAEATPGADEIIFSESLLDFSGNVWINIQSDPASPSLIGSAQTNFTGFEVNSADGLTINGDVDGDGLADVEINGGFVTNDDRYFITPHFMIGSEGALTLEALDLISGGMYFFEAAADAGIATASNKSPKGTDGQDAFGSILNQGTLVLDRVTIDETGAIAQDGGNGGKGLDARNSQPVGFNGTDGALGVTATKGGDGFEGDDGSVGGSGGQGGNAAGAILNYGDLTLINTVIGSDVQAEAGDGGIGGKGGRAGNGSDGGQGGDAYTAGVWNTSAKVGGDGGDTGRPGTGGRGGDGGDAALAILNVGGTVTHQTALAVDGFDGTAVAGDAGNGGPSGDRGTAGSGGLGGERSFGGRADSGSNGIAWFGTPLIFSGLDGTAADFLGGSTPASTADALVFFSQTQTGITEGEDLVFHIGHVTNTLNVTITVTYEVVFQPNGAAASDFALGQPLSGSVVLTRADPSAAINLATLLDADLEGSEVATIAITDVSALDPGLSLAITGDPATTLVNDALVAAPAPGTAGNDLISGTDFNDKLLGNGGNDFIRGNEGADLLAGGTGYDRLVGDAGADQFVFAADGDFDIVYDFTDGVDRIALVDLQFADLTISEHRSTDTLISYADAHMILRDVAAVDIDEADFFLITESDLI